MKLSIIIPCYNEADNIPLIVKRINSMTSDFSRLEILLVDNGSTDDSASVLAQELPPGQYPYIKVVTVDRNQGYGWGILSGLREATGDYLAWTHADMQTDPADVLTAWENALQTPNPELVVIKGCRKNRNLMDSFFTFGMTLVSSWALKMWLSDVNAQPKLFSRRFYLEMVNPPWDFSLDLYVLYLAKLKGYKLKTIPVYFKKRLHGEAKGGGSFKTKWKLIKRTFAYIFKLKKELADSSGGAK